MAENPLNKLSVPAQVGIAGIVAVAICVGFYFLWWSEAVATETRKADALKKLEGEIQALRVTAAKLPEFQREVQLLEASLEKLKLILPTEKQMPDLMKRLQSLTQQSSLTVRDFTPSQAVTQEFYQEVPIALRVTGSYHNLGAFFDRVGRLVRLVNIRNVKISAANSQTVTNTIDANLTATAFMYRDEPPAPAKGAKGAKGGK